MENKRITLLNLVWVMFLFLTFTEFNWFFLTMSVIIAPLWSEIYNVAKINQNAKKQNEPIIEQFEEDLKNGNYWQTIQEQKTTWNNGQNLRFKPL